MGRPVSLLQQAGWGPGREAWRFLEQTWILHLLGRIGMSLLVHCRRCRAEKSGFTLTSSVTTLQFLAVRLSVLGGFYHFLLNVLRI